MDRPDQIEAETIYARRKWSAERLEIPLNASKKEARVQWLKSLEEADFLPDEIHLPAWRIVTSAESAAEARKRFPDWTSHFDDGMSQEIESFAQRFFTLDPADRRKEFTRLFNASRDNPRHQKRISSLSPGLALPAVADQDSADEVDAELMLADVEALSQHLRSMFLATPPARARMHLAFLRDHSDELPRWGAAAKVLKDTQSPLINLVPEQWEELTGWDVRQRQAAAFQEGLEERVALEAIETQRHQSSSRDDSGSFLEGLFFNRYSMFFVVWIVIKLVGALASNSSSPPRGSHNLPQLSSPTVRTEDYLRRFEAQRQQRDEARRWITMEEEEFKANNGEAQVKALGIEEDRRAYWEWRAKFDEYEAKIDERIEQRNKLQIELQFQKRLEVVWKIQHQAKFDNERNSATTSDARQKELALLEDELVSIQLKQLDLQAEIKTVEGELQRLNIQIAGLTHSDPSKRPIDGSP